MVASVLRACPISEMAASLWDWWFLSFELDYGRRAICGFQVLNWTLEEELIVFYWT